jgi:hypothetical protein
VYPRLKTTGVDVIIIHILIADDRQLQKLFLCPFQPPRAVYDDMTFSSALGSTQSYIDTGSPFNSSGLGTKSLTFWTLVLFQVSDYHFLQNSFGAE